MRSWLVKVVGLFWGLGPLEWTFEAPDRPVAEQLMDRLGAIPRTAVDLDTELALRHRADYFTSPYWGSMVTPIFERFSVTASASHQIHVRQVIAPGFLFVAGPLLLGSYCAAIVGIVAAARGIWEPLVFLVAPIFFRLIWVETTRLQSAKDFRQFLESGAQVRPLRN